MMNSQKGIHKGVRNYEYSYLIMGQIRLINRTYLLPR